VRIGKHITIQLEAASKEEATQKVETACRKLLANPIMEYFEFEVKEKS
jgi:phosphoribosylformylglycinamidine synthase subunit PurS